MDLSFVARSLKHLRFRALGRVSDGLLWINVLFLLNNKKRQEEDCVQFNL